MLYPLLYLKQCVEHGNGDRLPGREKLLPDHWKQPNRLHQCLLLPSKTQREIFLKLGWDFWLEVVDSDVVYLSFEWWLPTVIFHSINIYKALNSDHFPGKQPWMAKKNKPNRDVDPHLGCEIW